MSHADADLVVVVLQWGHADDTIACLTALRRSEGIRLRTIVVDNRSTERDAADRVVAVHPWVEMIRNDGNLGFAEGNNVALRRLVDERAAGTAPRHAMLLNNDVIVPPDALAEMLRVARTTDAAIVGAVNVVTGTDRIGSSGGAIRWPSATYHDQGADAVASGEEERVVDVASGSTFLCDLDALAEVGLLDPAYFCVYEEADLCLRMAEAGRACRLAVRARVQHAVGKSTGRKVHFYFRFRNRVRFARLRGGPGAVGRLLPSLVKDVMIKCGIGLVLLRPGEIAGVVRGAWHGLRGVEGPGPYVS